MGLNPTDLVYMTKSLCKGYKKSIVLCFAVQADRPGLPHKIASPRALRQV
jgi:hypothetical protein